MTDPMDELVIQQLEHAGADLAQPREIRHHFYSIDRAGASELAEVLATKGFTTEIEESAGKWLLRATHMFSVRDGRFAPMLAAFRKLSAAAGLEYDGWEAAATP